MCEVGRRAVQPVVEHARCEVATSRRPPAACAARRARTQACDVQNRRAAVGRSSCSADRLAGRASVDRRSPSRRECRSNRATLVGRAGRAAGRSAAASCAGPPSRPGSRGHVVRRPIGCRRLGVPRRCARVPRTSKMSAKSAPKSQRERRMIDRSRRSWGSRRRSWQAPCHRNLAREMCTRAARHERWPVARRCRGCVRSTSAPRCPRLTAELRSSGRRPASAARSARGSACRRQ